jgi:predicted transcriptional regulator
LTIKMRIHDILRTAVCSDLRRNLLISLHEGKKSLGELRDGLNTSSTTAIHSLRELEKGNLIFQDSDRDYLLTKIGKIIAFKLIDFSNAAEVLKKQERFWLEHDLSGIPDHMLEKIGWLKDSTLLESKPTDLFLVHATYIDMITKAKEIKGISPIFVPEFSSVYGTLAKKDVDIQLLVTEKVMDKIDKKILESLISDENTKLKLYILKEDVKVATTLTDYYFSLGFFNLDGSYDWNKDLISYDKKGIEWGRELFEWYLKKAVRIF